MLRQVSSSDEKSPVAATDCKLEKRNALYYNSLPASHMERFLS